MFIIVGLGNPGQRYQKTRHNVGFMVLNKFAQKHNLEFRRGRGSYKMAQYSFGNETVLLVKPQTYMNLSGNAVQEVVHFYKLDDLENLLIILDDINLPFGTIRFRPDGSDGGQKGLKSVINNLGTSNIPRLRIGIGSQFSNAIDYVLSPFNKEEKEDLEIILNWSVESVESYLKSGIRKTMNLYNKNYLTN